MSRDFILERPSGLLSCMLLIVLRLFFTFNLLYFSSYGRSKMSGKDPCTLEFHTKGDFWETESPVDDAIEKLLLDFESKKENLQSCLESMRQLLEKQLLDNDIKCTVIGRVKGVGSLRKRLYEKIEKMSHNRQYLPNQQLSDPRFEASPSRQLLDPKLSWTIWGLKKWDFDVLGLRIALYFPEQRRKVLELFDDKKRAQFVRKATESMENGIVINQYIDDEHETNSITDGNNELNLQPSHGSVDARDKMKDRKIALKKRFRGYTEELRYVSFKSDSRTLSKPFDELWVEVQVRSVIMDAYTNISHGLEYKALTGVLSDEEIQVLESINGLAQTGEVILQHLQHIHQQRTQSDLKRLDNEQIISEIANYMNLKISDDFSYPFSKVPCYRETLQQLFVHSHCNYPGKLKKLLQFYNVKDDYPLEFLEFSGNFPGERSLETYILHKILLNIREPQIDLLLLSSSWSKSRMPLEQFMPAILNWISKCPIVDRLDGDLTVLSSNGLAVLFCIFLYTEPVIGLQGIGAFSYYCEVPNIPKLILALMDIPELKVPFLVIAIFGALFKSFGYPPELRDIFGSGGSSFPSIAEHLARRPTSLVRGIQLLTKILEKISQATNISFDNVERVDITERITDYMSNTLPFNTVVDIAHQNPDTIFLDFSLAYVSLRGIDDLVGNEGIEFRPWLEGRPWVLRGGWTAGSSSRLRHLRIPPYNAFDVPDAQVEEQVNDRISLLSLDFTNIDEDDPRDPNDPELPGLSDLFQKSSDIIIVKLLYNPTHQRIGWWVNSKLESHYVFAEATFEPKNNDYWEKPAILQVYIKRSRFISTRAGSFLALGPVWKVKSSDSGIRALVCDLFVRSDQRSGYTRLRIPNIFTPIDSAIDQASPEIEELLPSTRWVIREGGTNSDTHQHPSAHSTLSPSVVINGFMGGEYTKSDYHLHVD